MKLHLILELLLVCLIGSRSVINNIHIHIQVVILCIDHILIVVTMETLRCQAPRTPLMTTAARVLQWKRKLEAATW